MLFRSLYYFNEAPDGTAPNRWEQYGTGTVSADGTRIVTDRNPATGQPYGMPRFCCGARGDVDLTPAGLPDNASSEDDRPKDGEPVDLATGRFIVRKTDLVLPGRLAVVVERTYRSENPRTGLLGVGWNLAPWESTLSQSGTAYLLTLADQSAYLLAGTASRTARWRSPRCLRRARRCPRCRSAPGSGPGPSLSSPSARSAGAFQRGTW